MRAFDVDLFEFITGTDVHDFNRLAGFEESLQFERMDCFHAVPSASKLNEIAGRG